MLGFVGKHTNLIHRRLGNWFFLAEIITTAELEPDAPEKNRCGSCSRCLAACPTQAITAPFQLDARLCISYLTIELKGPIPLALRPAIGNRIYGCDDCLAACPWNRFAQEGRLCENMPARDLNASDLLELLALTDRSSSNALPEHPWSAPNAEGCSETCASPWAILATHPFTGSSLRCPGPEPLIAEHAGWAIAEITRRGAIGAGTEAPASKGAE